MRVGAFLSCIESCAVSNKNIVAAVAIVIENSGAVTSRFENVVFVFQAAVDVLSGSPASAAISRKSKRWVSASPDPCGGTQRRKNHGNPHVNDIVASSNLSLLAHCYNCLSPLGGRLMVRLQTLDLRIGVRVPASQPNPFRTA